MSPARDGAGRDAVAVVGMACRLPGAADVREFWDLLSSGREGITRFGVDELIGMGADPEMVRRPDFVPAKGVLAGARNFDWEFFRFSRADAANIDPQQRVFLECASTAIDDAGLDPGRFEGRVGVYAGADRTPLDGAAELSPLVRVVSHEKDFLATRVAYKLGLRGPAVTVQTACSTSLTAIHMAAAALVARECDAALAGGVAVSPQGEWGYLHEPGSVLSPDGHCRTFDVSAAGTVPSEGVGVVVLKRLADALADDDRIAAVIRGSALNNDGADKLGFTAPSIPGQSEVIRHAQQVSGVAPEEIDYVECHGTATPMGDPVEVAALTDALGPAAAQGGRTIWLGAVKSNLGHTSAAAGVAGFIKTVLMLENRQLVPTLHFTSPNPLLDLDSSAFEVSTRTRPWPASPGAGVPTAAVSAFGVGGTNAHVILQGHPHPHPHPQRPGPAGARVLPLSAASPAALARMRRELAGRLAADDTLELARVARTLAGRRTFGYRQAVVAADRAQAAELLRAAAEPATAGPPGQVAFLLPGHGVLGHAAGEPAYRLLPEFRACFHEISELVRAEYALDLTPAVSEAAAAAAGPQWFDDVVHQQLSLFTIGCALGRQLGEWGIKPDALLGNSIGEYAAAALAGVWSLADAVVLVGERARAVRDSEPGQMVAVSAPLAEVTGRIPPGGRVSVSMISRGGVVLSGPLADMDELLASDALSGLDLRRLNIDRAGHTDLQQPAASRLTELIGQLRTQLPAARLISNITGGWAEPGDVCGPEYWAAQICRPVQLDAGMQTLLGSGCDTFIELGPGATMLGGLRLCDGWDPRMRGIPMLGRREDGERGLLRALGTLWEQGIDVLEHTLAVPAGQSRPARCSLPGHPFAGHDPENGDRRARVPVAPARAGPAAAETVPAQAGPALVERLWCRALGVPAAIAADDFFALGGESLTVLQLLRQLREETGVVVPAAEFMRQASFGRLLELVGEHGEAGPPPADGVVVLRAGSGRPVFLVADAAGSSLSYLDLAGHLDAGRPVYGLEPDGGSSARPVPDVAARHLKALTRMQPAGPYTIGGWSFGAVVAHEMAGQLAARGSRADLLICLDAYVPGQAGRPLAADARFVAGHLRTIASAQLGLGAVGIQARRNPALRRLLLDKFAVLARYRPQPVGCPALLLKAEVSAREAQELQRSLAPLYAGGVTVARVGGDHWSMLEPPHAAGLAARLLESLPPEPAAAGHEPARRAAEAGDDVSR